MTHYDAIPLADILEESLHQENSATITVVGSSMSPLLQPGDTIGLVAVDRQSVQPGQIVTFRDPLDPQELITHRVFADHLADRADLIAIRGDRTMQFDKPLTADDILGQVVWQSRNGRRLRLDQDLGAWLSRRLASLSEVERRQISGLSLAADDLTLDMITQANERILQQHRSSRARLLRFFIRTWSAVLSSLVILAAARKETVVEKEE